LRERMAPLATAMARDMALWSQVVRERDIRLD
jgi:hypothetical protein